MCVFVFLAMLVHLFRIYREYRPNSGLKLLSIPGIASVIAVMRSISYVHMKQRGPIRLPALQYCIALGAFFISLTVWVFSIKPYYRRTYKDGSPPLAIRTGMVAIALFPFIFACALKVNPISMLTGVSHAKLQIYHQVLAFIMFFMAVVHTIPFLIQPAINGGYEALRKEFARAQQFWSGTVCLGLVAWMLCSSLGVFRNMSYQFFVIQHIVTVCVLLGFLFKHIDESLKGHFFLGAAVAFWIFSIVVRGCMVLISSDFLAGSRAQVEVQSVTNIALDNEKESESGRETLRLCFSAPLKWRPGQHIYVRFPGFSPGQAHPFSIMSLPNRSRLSSKVVLIAKVYSGTTRKIFNYIENPSTECREYRLETEINTALGPDSGVLTEQKSTPDPEQGVFHHAGDASPKTAVEAGPALQEIRVRQTQVVGYLDGPYGYTTDPASYEHVVFYAGGTGIAHIFPIMLLLLRRSAEKDSKVLTKRVRFVWSTHSSALVNWLQSELYALTQLRQKAAIEFMTEIHVTGESAPAHKQTFAQSTITSYGIRPDTRAILEEEIEHGKQLGSSSLATYVCGPHAMTYDVSNGVAAANWAVVRGRMGTMKDIMLDAEDFAW